MAQISDVQKQMASQPRFACTAKHTSAPSITQLWYHVVLNAPDGCGEGEEGRERSKQAGERCSHSKCVQIRRRCVGIWPITVWWWARADVQARRRTHNYSSLALLADTNQTWQYVSLTHIDRGRRKREKISVMASQQPSHVHIDARKTILH